MKYSVAILAGGPSLTQEIADKVIASGVYTVAINNAWLLAPEANVLLATDGDWWKEYKEALAFKGEKIVMQNKASGFNVPSGVNYIEPHPTIQGSNGALQAAYLWMARGAEKLLLFGVDLRDDELMHHHGKHRGKLRNPTAATFARQRNAWRTFANKQPRPVVINCNLRSGLDCFPTMTIEEACRF